MSNPNLKNALDSARKGQAEGFEYLFILTYKDAYRHAALFTNDESHIWQMIRAVYTGLFRDEQDLSQEEDFLNQLFERIDEVGSHMFDSYAITSEIAHGDKAALRISEETAAGILSQIEEASGFSERDNAPTPVRVYVLSAVKLIVCIGLAALAVWLILFSIRTVKPTQMDLRNLLNQEMFGSLSTTSAADTDEDPISEHVGELETTKTGLQESLHGRKYLTSDGTWLTNSWMEADGHLYYFDDTGYAVTGELQMENRIYAFWDDGVLVSLARSADTEISLEDSIQKTDGHIYYLKHLDAPEPNRYNLYRTSQYELEENLRTLVVSDIQDYLIYGDHVYYMQGHTLQKATLSEESYQTEAMDLCTVLKDDAFYFVNDFEKPFSDGVSELTLDQRTYRLDQGKIRHVTPALISTRGITYYLTATSQSAKSICWRDDTGKSGILADDGYWIDSFCLAGDWIYYSVYIGKTDGIHRYSRIYKINIDGQTKEVLSPPFQGHMMNLYFYPDKGQIYGEYVPDANTHRGSLATISLSGNIEQINDTTARTGRTTTGGDTLELVMVSDDTISCYWHDCDWDAAGGAKILWTVPIELSDSDRLPIN